MKAIILNEAGSVDNLQFVDIAKPMIKNNEVLVKTISLSVNPVDYKVRSNNGTLTWVLGECIIPVKVDSKIRSKVNSKKEVFRIV